MQNIDEIWTNKKFRRFGHFSPILTILPIFGHEYLFFCWRFSHFEFLFNVSEITKGCFLPWCLGNDPILEDLNDFSKFCGLLKKKDIRPRENTWKMTFGCPKNASISVKKMFFKKKLGHSLRDIYRNNAWQN